MKKILLIGWKDLKLAFRDRTALIMMLLTPFLLTLGLGFVTGRFSGGSSSGVSDIPVILVNLDQDQLGNALVELFNSDDLAGLVKPVEMSEPAEARLKIDQDEAAAAIVIPKGYTSSIIPAEGGAPGSDLVQIEVYANPTRPTSAGVLQTIVEEFTGRVEVGRIGGEVAILQMLQNGLIKPDPAALEAAGREIGQNMALDSDANSSQNLILLNRKSNTEPEVQFDVLAYLAPGMALMFLMYTVSRGGMMLLVERTHGTLPRLLVSPTTSPQVLAGKILGIFLTGTAQILILVGGTTLLFQLKWGDPLAVIILVLAAVAGATGWGMLLTAFARTPGQVGSVGSAVMLIFGILGGSFISLENLPVAVQWVSKITPNAWGLDGFTTLALGGNLGQIWQPVLALLLMGLVLFGISLVFFNRRAIMQR